MTDVTVETQITQVKDGTDYAGHLKIGESTFTYGLIFSIPINRLDGSPPARELSSLKQRFQITVRRDEKDLSLTDYEYRLFLGLLVGPVVEFYNLPQTRSSNEGMQGATMRGAGWKDGLGDGLDMSIGLSRTRILGFPEDICQLFNSPKFGCALTA